MIPVSDFRRSGAGMIERSAQCVWASTKTESAYGKEKEETVNKDYRGKEVEH
ncbi:MAG: hypothetical protein ABSD98_07850 [Candidatus Korobacteraceae bacterium]